MKKIISALFLMVFASTGYVTNAVSMDISIGVAGTHAGFYGQGTEELSDANDSNSGKSDTSEAGAFLDTYPSIFAEVGLGDVIDLGLEYVPQDIDTPENTNIQHDGGTSPHFSSGTKTTNTAKASFSDYFTFYANVNLPWYGLYLKGGYSMADVQTKEKLNTGSAYPDVDTEGWLGGFGISHTTDMGVFVRAEVTATQWDDVSAVSTQNGQGNSDVKKVKITDMLSGQASLRIGKTF
tara:strand:+ start:199 stop:909 length:711 start_codon:yes stop_codon:yes gene_type:complete